MPTIVKTRPEATLFCKKDVLPVFELTFGVALGDDCTITVEVCTGTDVSEGVIIALDEVLVGVGDATGADEGVRVGSALLDDNLVLGTCQPCMLRHRYWKTHEEDALSDFEALDINFVSD